MITAAVGMRLMKTAFHDGGVNAFDDATSDDDDGHGTP